MWKAAQIIGKRASRAGIEYRVTWDGYDMTYDTWEPCENIVDTSLIDEFEASIDVSIPLQQPVGQLREAVAARMMKIKAPEKGVSVDVPLAAFLPVARTLLAHAARPPSRRGRKPLQLEYDTGPRWRTIQLQLEQPEDIGWLLQLHQQRDGAYGAAIVKKGRGGNSNMTVMGGVVLLAYTEPVPRDDGLYVPGAKFTLTGNVWIFQGRDGAPRPSPGLPNEQMLAPLREYLKNLLRGRARWGLEHRLTATWAQLPTAREALTKEEAQPRRSVKRVRAGPSTGGEAAPAMGALE